MEGRHWNKQNLNSEITSNIDPLWLSATYLCESSVGKAKTQISGVFPLCRYFFSCVDCWGQLVGPILVGKEQCFHSRDFIELHPKNIHSENFTFTSFLAVSTISTLTLYSQLFWKRILLLYFTFCVLLEFQV